MLKINKMEAIQGKIEILFHDPSSGTNRFCWCGGIEIGDEPGTNGEIQN